jgi:ATP-dependent helicase HepA
MQNPVPGQRWVSDSEPELGLGIILRVAAGRVEIMFPAANEHRQYALSTAPLRRVIFKEADHIKLHSGADLVVDRVEERAGLLVYIVGDREIAEAELSDTISFSKPEERLRVWSHGCCLRTKSVSEKPSKRDSSSIAFISQDAPAGS